MDEKQERTARFLALVTGLCRLCGAEVPAPMEVGDGPIWVNVSIDEAPLCLSYSPLTDADQFVVETELCRPDPEQELQVLRLALEVNLLLARNRHMTLGRHPQTEAVVLLACLPLDRVSPESLLTSMALMAQQRAAWASGQVLHESLAPQVQPVPPVQQGAADKPGPLAPSQMAPTWVE